MGRRAKNANHPLVRLRQQLSTPTKLYTRKELARKAGVPEASLKDIEAGKYKMSDEVVAKISIATGVHHQSLQNNGDPLLDWSGSEPLSPQSVKMEHLAEILVDKATLGVLVSAALEAATKKGVSYQFQFLLQGWLCKTSKAFGLDELIRGELTAALGSFMPGIVPPYFWPQTPKPKASWNAFVKELLREHKLVEEELLMQDPGKAERRERFLHKPRTGDPKEAEFELEYRHDVAESQRLALERCKTRLQGRKGQAIQLGEYQPSPHDSSDGEEPAAVSAVSTAAAPGLPAWAPDPVRKKPSRKRKPTVEVG